MTHGKGFAELNESTKALMLAALVEALRHLTSKTRNHEKARDLLWVASNKHLAMFDFVTICEVLKLDPDAVRKALRDKTVNHRALVFLEFGQLAMRRGTIRTRVQHKRKKGTP